MMRSLPLFLGLLATCMVAAQEPDGHRDCAAHTLTQRWLQQQGVDTDVLRALPAATEGVERGGTLTIPVVVHVVWNTAAENVPDAAIQAIIDELNRDYAATNTDLSNVRSAFTGSIGNPGIQFCLAQVDPSGNATTGITRTQTTDTWFDPDTQTNDMKSPPLGRSPWNPLRYLNIWICDITSGATGGTVTVGYAYLPVGGIVGSAIDGLVIDQSYGLQIGGRTATHEIGHYLGLLHPFDNGNCTDSDGFTDTPLTNSPTFSCSNTSLVKCGVLTQYENYMDYSNCPVMFTDQQSSYMGSILTGVRSQLLTPGPCGITPVGPCIPTAQVGTAEGDYINRVALGTFNNSNSGGTSAPAYTNFSGTYSTSLQRGNTYTITIQGGSYSPDNYAAWIDYDQDNTFEAGEKLGEFATTAVNQTQTINFTVPAGAALGNTRLRVRGVFHNDGEPTPTDPCYNYIWGETEDYGITITSPGGSYCIPTSAQGTSDGDYINGVQLGTINNLNSGGPTAPTYTNYSSTWSASIVRSNTYTVTIQSGGYTPDNYAVWIDYDQNFTFAASEKLGEFTNTAIGQSQNITFTVPGSALLGPTRMRVRGVYHNTGEPTPTDPCYNYAYGETEDYRIVIESTTDLVDNMAGAFRLFPNPATDQLTIVLGQEGPAEIEVLDMQGRLIATHRSTSDRVQLPLTGIAAGSYVLSVVQGHLRRTGRFEVTGDH
jgi:hypothetical protein